MDRQLEPGLNGHNGRALFATTRPTLWPHMLVPRLRSPDLPFPFSDPSVRYFYFARNGVYWLARHFGLDGQEVLFPAYFHGVELEALTAAGVKVRFFPVRQGMRVNPEEVIDRIGSKTRAIYLTHYAGFPGPVVELRDVCRERGLLFIEDCALALLSCLGTQALGTFGDAAIFCLYKTVPTPNGGAVVLREGASAGSPEGQSSSLTSVAAHTASSLLLNLEVRTGTGGQRVREVVRAAGKAASRAGGRDSVPTGTQHFNPAHADHTMGRLSRLVLRTQDYARIVQRRRENYASLVDLLGDVAPSVLGDLPDGVCPLFYPLQLRNRAPAMAHLSASGIKTADFWSFPHPALPQGEHPEVDELRRTVVWLPCHQDLTPAAIERVATAVREVADPL